MGNCLRSHFCDPSTRSSVRNNGPSTSGTSKINYSNTTIDFSATSGSAASKSQFSEALSHDEGDEATNNPIGQILESPNLKEFTFADLKSTTKNFKSDTLLGGGGFGKVYKGWIDERTYAPSKSGSGMVVAIKKLNPESMQGFQEWQFAANPLMEGQASIFNSKFQLCIFNSKDQLCWYSRKVNFPRRLSHPNLVKLLGYCWEDKELLLVYEFMQKGSLENHLFRKNPHIEPLSWDIRLKIAIGAARGLTFLHTSDKKVIYRDFKASNILLDGNYNAKISEFGLAKLGPSGGESHVTTRVMGTYGYAAPEYIATGHLYVKSDVYGFGVVLLEMLTGQRALDTKRPSGQQNLIEWLRPLLSQKKKLKTTIMDARIEGQYSSKAMVQAAQLTLRCLEADPRNRPSMKEVLEVLEQIEAMKQKPKALLVPRYINPMAEANNHTSIVPRFISGRRAPKNDQETFENNKRSIVSRSGPDKFYTCTQNLLH